MAKYSLFVAPVEDIIFLLGIVTAYVLLRLRYQDINGNKVPVAKIFNNTTPTFFHTFLIALNVGFTAAVLTLFLRSKSPTVARFCRRSAVASVVVAAGLLFSSALASYFSVDSPFHRPSTTGGLPTPSFVAKPA